MYNNGNMSNGNKFFVAIGCAIVGMCLLSIILYNGLYNDKLVTVEKVVVETGPKITTDMVFSKFVKVTGNYIGKGCILKFSGSRGSYSFEVPYYIQEKPKKAVVHGKTNTVSIFFDDGTKLLHEMSSNKEEFTSTLTLISKTQSNETVSKDDW